MINDSSGNKTATAASNFIGRGPRHVSMLSPSRDSQRGKLTIAKLQTTKLAVMNLALWAEHGCPWRRIWEATLVTEDEAQAFASREPSVSLVCLRAVP